MAGSKEETQSARCCVCDKESDSPADDLLWSHNTVFVTIAFVNKLYF